MRKLDNELENKKIIIENLIDYGFIKNDTCYLFEYDLSIANFKMIVEIKNNKMTSKVIDITTNEDYLLVDIATSSGEFVGKIREEYECKLQDIIEKCTIINIFKSKQAKEIIKYVKDKYNDDLEYLWAKFPKNAIWRNDKNNKWYGALLVIEESKLGLDSNKVIEIIDLRYQKDKIKDIIDNEKVFQGYHMNKDNWITIRLDESVDIKEIYKLIDNSYELSLEK